MNLSEIIQKEKEIKNLIIAMVEEIKNAVTTTEIKGVKRTSPLTATVNFSALDKGILTPDYYLSDKQAEAVYESLKRCETCSSALNRITEMINSRYAKIGNNKIPLNSKTLEILGRYCSDIEI